MKLDEECLERLVHLDKDIEGTPLKRGFVGVCTADLPDQDRFAVIFRPEDAGETIWWAFETAAKEHFTVVDESRGFEQFE